MLLLFLSSIETIFPEHVDEILIRLLSFTFDFDTSSQLDFRDVIFIV